MTNETPTPEDRVAALAAELGYDVEAYEPAAWGEERWEGFVMSESANVSR